jgi:hypothetical protein
MYFKRWHITSLLKHQVKGGALYIAIFISIIISVFLSLLIVLSYQNSRTTSNLIQTSQLYCHLNSALEIVQSSYFSDELNNHWIKSEFNDDSIRITKLNWGAYWLINAEAKNRHASLQQSGIYGTNMTPDTALMIADNGRPIGLSGKVSFKATCYLPQAGIKAAYIEGQSYQPNFANASHIRINKSDVPQPEKMMVDGISNQQKINVLQDSLVYTLPDNFSQSFVKKTLVLEINSGRLSNKHWNHNIKLVSNSSIEIDSSCHLDNILIIAKKIKFLKGFKGKVHVIASDSIKIEGNCQFNYPSSLVIINESELAAPIKAIVFDKDCQFFGGLLALNTSNNLSGTKVFIKLNASSSVSGFIYSSDYAHLEGELNATVITRSLLLQTPSAVYENHIINCDLNPKKLGHLLAIPPIFTKSKKLVCCQKINT